MSNIDKVLDERGRTHGHWPDQAAVSEALWQLVQRPGMSPSQLQGLHMICTKLSRIATGNENEPDHWVDIAGYATLVARHMDAPRVVFHETRIDGTGSGRLGDGPDKTYPARAGY